MTNVCTDLQQLDLAAPAPFSHPVLVKFWNNFRVFNASKEFGVPLLTVLSLNKMDVDLQSTYPLVGFTELVRVVFDTTNTIIEEPALFLAEGCASHISSLIRYTSFENLLKVKPLLGYLVIKELVKHLGVSPTAGEVAVPADSVISFDNHGSSTAENGTPRPSGALERKGRGEFTAEEDQVARDNYDQVEELHTKLNDALQQIQQKDHEVGVLKDQVATTAKKDVEIARLNARIDSLESELDEQDEIIDSLKPSAEAALSDKSKLAQVGKEHADLKEARAHIAALTKQLNESNEGRNINNTQMLVELREKNHGHKSQIQNKDAEIDRLNGLLNDKEGAMAELNKKMKKREQLDVYQSALAKSKAFRETADTTIAKKEAELAQLQVHLPIEEKLPPPVQSSTVTITPPSQPAANTPALPAQAFTVSTPIKVASTANQETTAQVVKTEMGTTAINPNSTNVQTGGTLTFFQKQQAKRLAAAAAAQATDGAPPSPANPAGVPPQRLKENEPLDAVPGVLALRMQAAAKQQMSNGSSALPPPLSSRTNGQVVSHSSVSSKQNNPPPGLTQGDLTEGKLVNALHTKDVELQKKEKEIQFLKRQMTDLRMAGGTVPAYARSKSSSDTNLALQAPPQQQVFYQYPAAQTYPYTPSNAFYDSYWPHAF